MRRLKGTSFSPNWKGTKALLIVLTENTESLRVFFFDNSWRSIGFIQLPEFDFINSIEYLIKHVVIDGEVGVYLKKYPI